MIGYLKGNVLRQNLDEIIIDVNGVGYRVRTASQIPSVGERVELYIYTYVREDDIALFGFESESVLNLFSMLLSVSGIGPKLAMSVVSNKKSNQIINAVQQADVGFFTEIPGLGKKGAQKIIIELKNKLGDVKEIDLADEDNDISMALIGMGYTRNKVYKVMSEIDKKLPDGEKIRRAMKLLSRDN